MNKKWVSYAKIAVFSTFLVLIDQLTKFLATIHLKGQNDFTIIRDVLHLHYLDGGNTGAAWGVLSGKITMFIVFTLIAVVIIFIFIRNIVDMTDNYSLNLIKYKILNYSFATLMAGAIGNLIDRAAHGYVIDFIYFKLINFPIFNVADCYVTISCVVIIIICMFKLKDNEFNQIFTLKKFKNE